MSETNPLIQSQVNKFRKDKFLLVLTIPNIMKNLNENQIRTSKLLSLNSLQFSVYHLTIPKISIPAHSVHFGQQNHNVSSYDREAYEPITINFEVDNEFNNYWVLWKWMQLLNDPKDASYAGKGIFPAGAPVQVPPIVTDYVTDLVAYSLDEYNNKKVKFSFSQVFITNLGELEYNYRDPEQLQCSGTFVFDQMNMELIGGTTGINS